MLDSTDPASLAQVQDPDAFPITPQNPWGLNDAGVEQLVAWSDQQALEYESWLAATAESVHREAAERDLVNAVDADGFPPLDDTDLAIIEAAKADILSRNPGMAWPKPITRRCVKVGAA